MESYPKFQNEVGAPIVRIGCHEFECIGDKPPQDHPHVYLNMGDGSDIVCPIALRYSVSIRSWAHAKLIQQNVLTVTSTESKSSKIASLVMLPAADHRKTPLPRTVGDLSRDRKGGVKTRKPDKFLHFPPTGDLGSGRRGATRAFRRRPLSHAQRSFMARSRTSTLCIPSRAVPVRSENARKRQ
jgi:uncharacterized Zn-finger protein